MNARTLPDKRLIDVLVLCAGGLLPLAFAPFALWPLIYPLLMFLFWSWLYVSPRRAAWRGLLFGCGAFGVGTSWVYVSLNKFGGMAPPIAAIAVVFFVLLLAIFIALSGWLTRRLHGPGWSWRLVLLAPAVWTLIEWSRGLWVLSFPWLSVGYSQSSTAIAGVAAIGSAHLLSFIVVLLSVLALGLLPGSVTSHPGRAQSADWKDRTGCLLAIIMVLVCSIFSARVEWTQAQGEAISIAMIQANIPIEHKWQANRIAEIEQTYLDMSNEIRDVDLIVWPEAAVPHLVDQLGEDFWASLEQHPATFLFGAVEGALHDGRPVLHNSAVLAASEQPIALYRKRHLVAFGEYVPFGNWLRAVVEYMAIPMADMRPWPEPQGAFSIAGVPVGISICYEDSFAEDMRRSIPEARLLINISEDAWFGDSFGPHQRQQMGVVRAIETGRPLLRSSNTGVTSVIDQYGREIERAPMFERTVLRVEIQPVTGVTPFARFGIWPILAISLLLVLLSLATSIVRRSH